MNRDDRYEWLALSRVPGIGRVLYRRLIERFGSPGQVFQASRRELLEVEGLGRAGCPEHPRSKGE